MFFQISKSLKFIESVFVTKSSKKSSILSAPIYFDEYHNSLFY
jgi:hypothetical protein